MYILTATAIKFRVNSIFRTKNTLFALCANKDMKQKVEFTNSKGRKLVGYFVTPENPKGTVVLVHGLNGNKEEWRGFPELVEAGYRIFVFDMIGKRACGGAGN